jgi:hypothetical protein
MKNKHLITGKSLILSGIFRYWHILVSWSSSFRQNIKPALKRGIYYVLQVANLRRIEVHLLEILLKVEVVVIQSHGQAHQLFVADASWLRLIRLHHLRAAHGSQCPSCSSERVKLLGNSKIIFLSDQRKFIQKSNFTGTVSRDGSGF